MPELTPDTEMKGVDIMMTHIDLEKIVKEGGTAKNRVFQIGKTVKLYNTMSPFSITHCKFIIGKYFKGPVFDSSQMTVFREDCEISDCYFEGERRIKYNNTGPNFLK
jgi:hypothetical protein